MGGFYQENPVSDDALAQWRLDRRGPAAFFSQDGKEHGAPWAGTQLSAGTRVKALP